MEKTWRVHSVSWEKAIGLDNKLVFIRLVNWILAPKARPIFKFYPVWVIWECSCHS